MVNSPDFYEKEYNDIRHLATVLECYFREERIWEANEIIARILKLITQNIEDKEILKNEFIDVYRWLQYQIDNINVQRNLKNTLSSQVEKFELLLINIEFLIEGKQFIDAKKVWEKVLDIMNQKWFEEYLNQEQNKDILELFLKIKGNMERYLKEIEESENFRSVIKILRDQK